MANDLVAKANAAYVDDDHDTAIDLYTQAIAGSPDDAGLYAARSQTHIKQEDWLSAFEDAKKAVELDPQNHKALYRKGFASYNLGEYETAKDAFDAARVQQPSNRAYSNWVAMCNKQLGIEEQANSHHTTIRELPASTAAAAPSQSPVAIPVQPAPQPTSDASAPIVAEAPTQQPSRYRHEWLQTQQWIEVAVFAKKLTKERVTITIEQQRLHVVIRDPQGDQEYEMDVKLYDPVDAEASTYELLSTKIEVRLKKVDLAISWPTLEASDAAPAANWSLPTGPPTSYPTSRKNVVDWNKLEADLKAEEKTEQLDGEAGVNKLFRDIYSGADEDTRRAMNKSFQESNGTCLSTNWKDIGSKKTEFKAPDDADVKKFEY